MPTPFDNDGNVDSAAFQQFCHRQIHQGGTALVVCGTTGEAPTLNRTEHGALIRLAVDVAGGRIPVIAGAGSNSTAPAIELSKDAEACGADAVLSVVPYYNKPTQAGLCAHFCAIAQSSGLPIILYDVPARTACSLADETVARLAEMPQFIGLKDAAGDVTRPARMRRIVRPDFRLLSGDDATTPAFLAQAAQIRTESARSYVAQGALTAGGIGRSGQDRNQSRHGESVRRKCRSDRQHVWTWAWQSSRCGRLSVRDSVHGPPIGLSRLFGISFGPDKLVRVSERRATGFHFDRSAMISEITFELPKAEAFAVLLVPAAAVAFRRGLRTTASPRVSRGDILPLIS